MCQKVHTAPSEVFLKKLKRCTKNGKHTVVKARKADEGQKQNMEKLEKYIDNLTKD